MIMSTESADECLKINNETFTSKQCVAYLRIKLHYLGVCESVKKKDFEFFDFLRCLFDKHPDNHFKPVDKIIDVELKDNWVLAVYHETRGEISISWKSCYTAIP